jgi:drug/metabolite transporter (DMT)-like permease
MDLTRLRTGELLAAAGALALLGVAFLDWYGDESAWQALPLLRVAIVLVALLALGLAVLTAGRRPVALPVAAGVVLIALGALLTFALLVRLAFPPDGASRELGALAGLLAAALLTAGAWRTVADERTGTRESREQAERTLAVRGAARPVPPPRTTAPASPPDLPSPSP